IHIKDLGHVVDSAETQTAVVRIDGSRGVFMRVNKQPGANTIAVVDQVRDLLPKVTGVPPGVNVGITFDQSVYIRQAIESLWHEAIQGSALAFIVILVFLRSLTSTLIISIAIPLSILLSFICMYFLGQTLNVFTLGGLALAVGRLVDDSIVELENINRHLNLPGTPRRKAVLDAAREVAMPIFSATITTIIVFVPTVFLEGQIKLLFIPLTFTISISLFASFLISRTVTPLLALRVLQPEKPIDPGSRRLKDRVSRFSIRFFERMESLYQRLIEWALGHRGLVVGSVVVAFAGSLFLVLAPSFGLRPLIGTEFFPASDEAQFRINIKAPIGTRIEETERIVKGMESVLRATLKPEELTSVVSNIGIPQGRSAVFTNNTGPHSATIQVYLASANPSIFTDPRTGNQYNLVVQLDEPYRQTADDLARLFVTVNDRPVLLSTVARITQSAGPVEIERKYQQRLVRVAANAVGRDLGSLSEELEAKFRQLPMPAGFSVRMGGQTEQQRESFSSLYFTAILAVILVYMVLASQFKSLKDPFTIMFSVPMGLIGVFWALYLTHTTLSTTSFMGIIMM